MLDHALAAARRGIRVFPCWPGTTNPCFKDNLRRATTREEILRAWWAECPDANPAGVFDLVIDVDVKDGKRGAEGMADLEALDLLPVTYTQRSPTGGWHFFYSAPGADVPNSVGKIRPGVDVRGHHGFVLLAGAQRPDGSYTISKDLPFAEAPGELVRLCGERRKRDPAATDLDPALADHPADIARTVELLRGAQPAIEGQGGDQATFDLGCRLHDHGVSEATALQLMLEHWNDRCSPPWDVDDLAQKVCNAYRYAHDAAGSKSVAADFGAPDPEAQERVEASRPRLFYLTFEEAARSALENPPEPLVEDWLDQGAMSVLYGDSNSGKTFVMLDVAFHIASGRPWNGWGTKAGAVVYVAAEGGKLFGRRLAALEKVHGGKVPLFVVPCPVDLLRPQGDLKPLIGMIAEIEAKAGKVVLVVIDTLSRALAGGDENSPVDMGAFIKNMDRLRHAAQAHLAIVHHTGKDAARGARGWSGMRAAVDTEMEISDGTLKATKQRDMEYGPELRFKLASVDLGRVGKRRITSAAVEWATDFDASVEACDAVGAAIEAHLALNEMHGLRILRSVMSAEQIKAAGLANQDVTKKLREEFDGAEEILLSDGKILVGDFRKGRTGCRFMLKSTPETPVGVPPEIPSEIPSA